MAGCIYNYDDTGKILLQVASADWGSTAIQLKQGTALIMIEIGGRNDQKRPPHNMLLGDTGIGWSCGATAPPFHTKNDEYRMGMHSPQFSIPRLQYLGFELVNSKLVIEALLLFLLLVGFLLVLLIARRFPFICRYFRPILVLIPTVVHNKAEVSRNRTGLP